MSGYKKSIELTYTGMVIASVDASDGRRVGLEFFHFPLDSRERRLKKAHKWADNIIALCVKYETIAQAIIGN